MKTPKAILDRRRSIRIAESLPFKIGHQGYDLQTSTLNISASGAWCLVEKEIPVMTQLNIALSLPGESRSATKKIRLKGTVVRREKEARSGKFYIAIYFSDVKPADAKHLKKYIDDRLTA